MLRVLSACHCPGGYIEIRSTNIGRLFLRLTISLFQGRAFHVTRLNWIGTNCSVSNFVDLNSGEATRRNSHKLLDKNRRCVGQFFQPAGKCSPNPMTIWIHFYISMQDVVMICGELRQPKAHQWLRNIFQYKVLLYLPPLYRNSTYQHEPPVLGLW